MTCEYLADADMCYYFVDENLTSTERVLRESFDPTLLFSVVEI